MSPNVLFVHLSPLNSTVCHRNPNVILMNTDEQEAGEQKGKKREGGKKKKEQW